MAHKLKSQRLLLFCFIGSISLCGLIGIFALLLGEMTDFIGRVLATTATVGGASIFALAAAIPWERKRWQPVGPLGMLAVVNAMVFLLILIWLDPYFANGYKWFFKALFVSCVFAVALPHIGLLSLASLHRAYEIVRLGTVGAIALLGAALSFLIVGEVDPGELGARLLGVLGILDACGTVAVPILHRVSRIRSAESTVTTKLELTLTCPRCRTTQTLPVGRSKCTSCGLKFTIDIEEEHCPKCGYVLYQLTSDKCPECGTNVLEHQPQSSGLT